MCIVSFVVAVADNGVIGRGQSLPWRLRSDLRRFRKLTMGHPLIMGRKTFQSIGRPLDGRASIVVSRSAPDSQAHQGPEVFYAASWRQALRLAKAWAKEHGASEIFVIGGASLFETAFADCDRLYLTQVHGSPEGDVTWTAPTTGADWREISRAGRQAGPEDDFPVTDVVLERAATR